MRLASQLGKVKPAALLFQGRRARIVAFNPILAQGRLSLWSSALGLKEHHHHQWLSIKGRGINKGGTETLLKPEWFLGISSNGWTNSDLALEWLNNCFKKHTKHKLKANTMY